MTRQTGNERFLIFKLASIKKLLSINTNKLSVSNNQETYRLLDREILHQIKKSSKIDKYEQIARSKIQLRIKSESDNEG